MKKAFIYIAIIIVCFSCVVQKQAGILIVAEDFSASGSIRGEYFATLDEAAQYIMAKYYASNGSIDLSSRNYLNYKKGMKAYIVKCVDGLGKVNSRKPLVNGKAEVQLLNTDGTPVFENGQPKKVMLAPGEFAIVRYLK